MGMDLAEMGMTLMTNTITLPARIAAIAIPMIADFADDPEIFAPDGPAPFTYEEVLPLISKLRAPISVSDDYSIDVTDDEFLMIQMLVEVHFNNPDDPHMLSEHDLGVMWRAVGLNS